MEIPGETLHWENAAFCHGFSLWTGSVADLPKRSPSGPVISLTAFYLSWEAWNNGVQKTQSFFI
ncbi:hypothetical protein QUB60_28850 [Microcoleus sp. A2-C5]|uniref:hypothetical protein n=1 Tax=unclassified Microcoleus TaxID=2642155 RepID=UPI002FD3134F